jgi:hypothetical protein
MTEQQIFDFNKKCAKFIWSVKTDWLGEDNVEVKSVPQIEWLEQCYRTMDHRYIFHVNQCKFHLDWNWIMKVVQKIQQTEVKLSEKYKRGFLKDETTGQICFSVSYDARVGYKGWTSLVSIELSPPYIYDTLDNEGRFETCLEATITAIDKFLDWYEQNN